MKPKIIQSLLAQVSQQLKELKAQRETTLNEKQRIDNEINQLENMPVCRDDFALLLKESLATQAQPLKKQICRALTHKESGSFRDDGSAIRNPVFPANKRAFMELANPHDWLLSGWTFEYSPFGSSLDRDGNTLKMLLWLFPDQIHAQIMQAIDEEIGTTWGNEDLPRITQRRERIAKLQTERAALIDKLAELDSAIAEIGSIATQNA